MAPSSKKAEQRPPASEVIGALKRRFPVCLSSDEFHFFPQAVPEIAPGAAWDDFSADGIGAACTALSGWKTGLRCIEGTTGSRADRIDAAVLARIAATLQEQFTLVGPQRTQPTFHLTVLAIGLGEALEADEEFRRLRIEEAPAFLDRARESLREIPRLFQEMGLEMTRKISGWLSVVGGPGPKIAPLLAALARFERHLQALKVTAEFRVEPEVYARIADAHIGCGLTVAEISAWLEAEIEETRRILVKESERLNPGRPWQETASGLNRPLFGEDPEGRYRSIIEELGRHCIEQRLVTPETVAATPIRVMPVPDHLRPVRSVAAYSMPPGHPPRGGTFFTEPGRAASLPGDWQLLAAHETYPGHHLLDAHRWSLDRPLLRHIEFPLFYEGWASFAEELLFDTGFFSGAQARLLMAKRRFWRAMRGRTDVALHWERRGLEDAASLLAREGLDRRWAGDMVRRYALKPGYQLCYTIGRLRFRQLYDRWTQQGGSCGAFVRRVMAAGETGFDFLAEALFDGD